MTGFKDKVVYQIYPKSFMDSNGDGLGDLKGVTQKLDYLQKLGVDYIWMCPFFVSPQKDNGYDVADYRNIDPSYGTMNDLEELIEEAKKRNIYLMFDMVFNHTSTEHEWFKKALAGDQKYKNYYIFKKPVNGHEPTNWISKFGGSAWEYVPKFDEYYLHLFDKTQADLNWENDEVKKELCAIVNYWIAKGVKGFRFDVVNLISKPAIYEDDLQGDGRRFYTDGPKIHEYLKYLNEHTFGDKEFITVGEMSSTTIENCQRYAGSGEHELSMVFNFHHLKVDYLNKQKWTLMPFDFKELKSLFVKWQTGMQEANAWNALFWNCHDQPRSVSRFGDDKQYRVESAKMLATAIHMMQGTPYIYQGEEIGMTNAYITDIKDYRDVESINYFNILKAQGMDEQKIYAILAAKSRDNARTPMQWDASRYGGFSQHEPWFKVNKNHVDINVEQALNDQDSIFYHYQQLIALRKKYHVISEGSYIPYLEDHPQVYAFKRRYENEELLVINNFYGSTTSADIDGISAYECLLSNYQDINLEGKLNLRPYESLILYKKQSA